MNYLFETSKNENATEGNFFKSMGTGFSRSRYSSSRLHGKAYGTTVFINMDSFSEGNSCSTDPNTLHRCWNNHCNHHKNRGLSRQDFDLTDYIGYIQIISDPILSVDATKSHDVIQTI